MNHLCISSLVVQARPAMLPGVRECLGAIAEAEVVAENDSGKMVVILDTANNREAADKITQIQNHAGILSANLIYQFDDQINAHPEGRS